MGKQEEKTRAGHKLVSICFGQAIYLGTYTFGGHVYCKLRLTENSWFPGKIIMGWPKNLVKDIYEE